MPFAGQNTSVPALFSLEDAQGRHSLSWARSRYFCRPEITRPGDGAVATSRRVWGRRQRQGQDVPLSLQHLQACDPAMSIRWQVVDKRIPLYANHKAILQQVAALFGAYY